MSNSKDNKYEEDLFYKYMESVKKIKRLTSDEENELFIKYNSGDETAKNKLIEANLRLVVNIAEAYSSKNSLDIMDIIQDGNKGLIKAVENFNISKGNKFSTYATKAIMRRIEIGLSKFNKIVTIPQALYYKFRKYIINKNELEQKFATELSLDELSELLNISIEDIAIFESFLKDPESFNEIKTTDSEPLENLLPDDKPLIEEIVLTHMMQKDVRELLNNSNLTNNEIGTIICRYYINKTLEETGKILKLSKERIRQIEKDSLDKLRMNDNTINFIVYMDDQRQARKNLIRYRQKILSQKK